MVTKHILYVLVAARYRPVMNTKEDIQKQQGLCRRQWGMQNSSEPQLCTSVRRRSLLSKWTPSSPGSPRDTHQVLSCHRLPIFVTGHHHPSQSLLHVGEAIRQGQHGHDLAGHCNVKLCLREQSTGCGQLRSHWRDTFHKVLAVTAGGYPLWEGSHCVFSGVHSTQGLVLVPSNVASLGCPHCLLCSAEQQSTGGGL